MAASTSRGQWLRRWLAILAPACATMLVAGVGMWVLNGYLIERGALGRWRMTVRGADGAVIGQGQAIIAANSWVWTWTDRPPFVAYSVELRTTATMQWNADGIRALGVNTWSLDRITSYSRMTSPERVVFFGNADGCNNACDYCSDFTNGTGMLYTVYSGRDGPAFPLTLTR